MQHIWTHKSFSSEFTGHHMQDLLLIHWPGAAHLALNSELHAQLRLQTWRVLEKIYSAGRLAT